MAAIEPRQQLVFDRIYAHLHADGEWPRLEDLQRQLASERQDVSVRATVMDSAAYAGILSPSEKVRLTLRGLAAVPAARPLLKVYLTALRTMIDRYRDTEVDARYTNEDLKQLELDPTIAHELSQLLHEDGWPFGSGSDQGELGWSYEISDRVLAADHVNTVEGLIAVRFGEALDEEDASGPQAEPLSTTPGATPDVDPDRPISRPGEDLFERVRLAHALAVQATADLNGQGFVIGVSGPWGSGKTSLLNLMAAEVKESETGYIVRFDPWLFSSSEELVLRFLREVSGQLGREERALAEAAARIGEYAQILAPLTALVAAPWLGPVVAISSRVVGRRRKQVPVSAQEQREKVCEALRGLDRRLVVLIDDVDRLQGDEIRDVVRLVKLVGDFPNTTYVLAYDQLRVARALDETDEQEGQAFLEKIVQLSYDMPLVDPTRLARVLGESISAAVGDISQYRFSQDEYTNLFASVRALFATVRDVRRYTNVLPGTLALIGDEVELADVLALEALRMRVPICFARIIAAKQALTQPQTSALGTTGVSESSAKQQIEAIMQAASGFEDEVTSVIKRLFPAAQRHLGGSSYGNEWLATWRHERRVAHPEVFEIYLQKALPSGVLPVALVERAFDSLQDRTALSALLDGLGDDDLESLLTRLEHYENEFPAGQAEIPVVVLFNQQHRLQRKKRHVLDLGADYAVRRVVLRVLRNLDEAEVVRITRAALPEIGTLGDRGDLVRMVGYRENSGHKLVSEADAAQIESSFFDELLTTGSDRLGAERDLIRLLWWIHGERPEATVNRVQELVSDDEFLLGLLRAALGETVGQGMGSAAVRRSYHLDWRSLTEFVPHDRLVERVHELDVPQIRDGLDERTKLALEQALGHADDPAAMEAEGERDSKRVVSVDAPTMPE
jgi:predicted KAP-like P-loop ATPase